MKSKRKRLIKKIIITLLFLIMGVIIFVTKSNVFIVKKVAVTGNPIITGEDVKERCEKVLGENIFFVSKSDLTKEAKKNPYVEAVTVTKKFPKQININIVEKEGIYYLDEGKNKLILSNRLVLLERTDDLRGRNLVEIKGIEYKEGEVGERVLEDNRISEILTTFYNIVRNNPTEYNISSIDLHDLTNIKVYIGEVEGRLGNDENLLDKMNKILHIVSSQEVAMNKGYIDVSFEGSPVYHHE
ncbi:MULTISPECIES: FtsQ-type POTRA domain-containing protein [unclassified Clostridium]|nr:MULTISPECIES: FtsQ-type POTRA domain-containing protein [unclassified Clostridium]MCR1273144.1 FtsQ-type POTRA domain-containing protein [Clostridium botulinum]